MKITSPADGKLHTLAFFADKRRNSAVPTMHPKAKYNVAHVNMDLPYWEAWTGWRTQHAVSFCIVSSCYPSLPGNDLSASKRRLTRS